jgi:HAD superfamily hydrolase (TIGR01490 family)
MRVGALFDIDHTLIAGDSALLFVRHLLQRGALGYRDLVPPLYYNLLYRLNLLDIYAVFRRYQSWVRGQPHAEMQALCSEWYLTRVRPLLYPEMAECVAEHRRAGHVVALLSSTTTYVAEPLARELGIEHLLVNRLLVADGRLTGEAVQPLCWGPGKAYWARRFAAEHAIDLEHSYFYSDSISDLPLLELVGHPRPVNPDRLLRRAARRRGWAIVDPRAPATLGAGQSTP